MAFTFGFYNSSNHDRMYDAEEFSRIFDGLITDGVYATIGNRFVVRAANEDNTIIIGSGRAWFNHSWSYNDTDMQMTGPASHALFNRWDAIVLDVNGEILYRTNSIIWITGDATSTPVKPTMIHTDKHNQYPLAYIYRPANNNAIPAVNITSCVGLDECPYTQGLVTDTKNIAPVENNDYASRAYNIGEYILWKNEFYKVTTAIAKNARIIPKPTSGYNITRSTMAEELYKTFTLDTVPTSGHYTNVVSSDGIYKALGNRSSIQTAAPASGGNNLITNGQVYTALGNRSSIQTAAPASGSNNLITAGQVYTALGNRSSIQTAAPASGSNNLITAGQVYTAFGSRTRLNPTYDSSDMKYSDSVNIPGNSTNEFDLDFTIDHVRYVVSGINRVMISGESGAGAIIGQRIARMSSDDFRLIVIVANTDNVSRLMAVSGELVLIDLLP